MTTALDVVKVFKDNQSQAITKKKKARVYFWATECKYSVILDSVADLDWKLVEDEKLESKVNLFWIDVATIHEHFRTIQPWQCINHFPGMPNIARKNRMGQNLNKMQKIFPKEYSFYPRTWVLPGEMADFRTNFDSNGNALNNKIFIIKPDAGCQGRGIFLTRQLDSVPANENVVAQVYIKKPLLIDGFKFDLRLYCIVTSVKPLRVYLFHDGLVRMCTEEYVKPTKENLGISCMHLTNYAVNKHNENFQQPSAQSSEEDQDGGHKRSLLWFMNWIRSSRGDAKADWLWRRMGVLCTRTIMSIIPILSREYDQHFKSFAGIPVDLSKIQTYASLNSNANNAATGAGGKAAVPPVGSRGRSIVRNNASRSSKESGSDSENPPNSSNGGNKEQEEEEEEEDEDESNQASTANLLDGEKKTEEDAEDDGKPKTRGSRCFEVLGFDIMLDNNLNPWLIEVNHLPSFGTDSQLDKDIKERLMQQVFSVLPVMSDDHAAYLAYHKAESEKRLNAQRAAAAKQPAPPEKRPMPPRRKEPPRVMQDNNLDSNDNKADQTQHSSSSSVDTTKADESKTDNGQEDAGDEEEDEECSPERLEEIKKILMDIYEKFSPEKLNKIDRLLNKYLGHEEEFLNFVFSKYAVSPLLYPSAVKKAKKEVVRDNAAEGEASESSPMDGANSQADGGQDNNESNNETDASSVSNELHVDLSALPSNSSSAKLPNNNNNNNSNNNNSNQSKDGKRYSRSLSPPRTQANTNKRPQAAWKMQQPDEEAAFRAEVFSIHIPDESEEWLKFEMSRLDQCTRIFPAVVTKKKEETKEDGSNNEDGKEENEEDKEENEDEDEDGKTNKKEDNKPKVTSATYDEIMFQVFLHDRRQTMRLRCPLPNRAKTDENKDNFLPPLDPPSSSRSSMSTMGTGRGVVGWKAPPKIVRESVVKQPTASQSESAKRLSQGLSVAHARGQRANANPQVVAIGDVATYSVVLDPQEMNSMPPPMMQDNGAWPSTKAQRLYEESRNNRMRIEANRSSNGAVLRQQVFYFDANTVSSENNTANAGLMPDFGGPQMQIGAPLANNNMVMMGGGLQGNAYQVNPNIQHAHGSYGLKMKPGQHSIAKATAMGVMNNNNSNMNPNISSSASVMSSNSAAAPYPTNMNPSNAPQRNQSMGGAGGTKQEELLRQLFPSWF